MITKLFIHNWHPHRLNEWEGRHWSVKHKLKKQDRDVVFYESIAQDVALATGKRRVSLHISLGTGERVSDPDAYWKSLLDALVHAKLLIDDSAKYVEMGQVIFTRGDSGTVITFEDL